MASLPACATVSLRYSVVYTLMSVISVDEGFVKPSLRSNS